MMHLRRTVAAMVVAVSIAGHPITSVAAETVDGDTSCTVAGFSPRSVSVGLVPVVVSFQPVVSGCTVDGWSIEGGEYDFYVHDAGAQSTFAPASNGETAPSDVVVSVYDADHTEYVRQFPSAFVLKRATAWSLFNAAPEPVRRGATITIKGQLTRADWDRRTDVGYSNRVVAVEFRTRTGTYRQIKTAKTGSGGHLTTTVTASANGYWRLRYGGNSTSGPSKVAGDFVDVT